MDGNRGVRPVRKNIPKRVLAVCLGVGIYSILAAIISTYFFGLSMVPYMAVLSAAGFSTFFMFYFLSLEARKTGLKEAFMGASKDIGDVVGRAILIVLYYTVFLIPGVSVSVFMDRLRIKKKPVAWEDKSNEEDNIERMREQW